MYQKVAGRTRENTLRSAKEATKRPPSTTWGQHAVQPPALLDIWRALLSCTLLAGNFVQIENSRAAVRGDKVSFRLLRKGGV